MAPVLVTLPEQPLWGHSMSQLAALQEMLPEQVLSVPEVVQLTRQLEPPQATLP